MTFIFENVFLYFLCQNGTELGDKEEQDDNLKADDLREYDPTDHYPQDLHFTFVLVIVEQQGVAPKQKMSFQ